MVDAFEAIQDASGFSGQAERRLVPGDEHELAQMLAEAGATRDMNGWIRRGSFLWLKS